MHNKFKNGSSIIVYGFGKNDGKFYKNKPAQIVQCDPYYKDYLVKFTNGHEDWISPQDIRRPYSRKRRK